MATVELHKGTRNFWRQRTNVDVNIIEHVELKVLELVSFNADAHKEVRLYLSVPGIMSRIDMGKAETMIAAKKEEYLRRKKTVAEKDIKNEVCGGLIAEHLLNRMSIEFDKETQKFDISISQTASDDYPVDYIIEKPAVLLPFPIDRLHKNSSAAEIADTIEKLKNDSLMLSRAMDKAERLQKYINMGSEGFKSLMATAQANRTKRFNEYSLPKQWWLKAINRIILQNCVQKVTEKIDAYEEKSRKNMNDALMLAISVADARTESSINPLSPRLQPLSARGGAAAGAGSARPVANPSGAMSARTKASSTRARRQTTETPNVKKESLEPPPGSHANPLASLLGGAGHSVAAAASAAAGALSSLTHAVEGALHKTKESDGGGGGGSGGGNSQKSKSSRSRRRSTLESKITPTDKDKSNKSERIKRNNSFRKENSSAVTATAAASAIDNDDGIAAAAEAAIQGEEEEYNFRLRRVTEMPTEKPADETEPDADAKTPREATSEKLESADVDVNNSENVETVTGRNVEETSDLLDAVGEIVDNISAMNVNGEGENEPAAEVAEVADPVPDSVEPNAND